MALNNEWVEFLEEHAVVILLRVSNSADAYLMFETLNGRGIPTSQIDLIKTYLYGRAGDRFNEVQAQWSHMRGALESFDDSNIIIDFMRHSLIVFSGFVREAGVYQRVQEKARTPSSVVTFTNAMESLAYTYVATFNSSHERWNDYPGSVRQAITVLDLFNIRPMRPLILAVGAKMAPKEAAKAFDFLVTLGVRLLIASSTRSASVEIPLAETAHKVYEESIKSAKKPKASLDNITPKDVEFREAFASARVSNAKLARYYLRSLEKTANQESNPWYLPQEDSSIINLEHILPKNPGDNWSQFTEDEVANHVNRLGNQVLVKASDNSSVRNASFEEKTTIYSDSPYVLTSQVAKIPAWKADAITKRQKKLAKLAVKTWPV